MRVLVSPIKSNVCNANSYYILTPELVEVWARKMMRGRGKEFEGIFFFLIWGGEGEEGWDIWGALMLKKKKKNFF